MPGYQLKPFVINPTDIDFLLAQVRFRPLFDAQHNAILNWTGVGPIYDGTGGLIWDGTGLSAAEAIALYGTSYQTVVDLSGIRNPSGDNNNLAGVHYQWGAVDQIFPRMAAANYSGYATASGLASSDYAITAGGTRLADDGITHITIGSVTDSSPRTISRLTTEGGVKFDTWASHGSDPDAANHAPNEIYYGPSGVASVVDWGVFKTADEDPNGLGQVDTQARLAASAGQNDHFIGGLNPGVSPSNGFFVLFGQFFDHGLDFIGKGSSGAKIHITLATDDPLYGMKGADGNPAHEITIARANVYSIDSSGPEYLDHTSPFIDQSQTYGSHQQLTDLLRQWVVDPSDPTDGLGNTKWKAGIGMFDGTTLAQAWTKPDGTVTHDTLPTLNELRQHVMATGRDALSWEDVLDLRNRDASGHLSGGNSGSALILDMNPRFDAAHLLNSDATFDSNHSGVIGDAGDIDLATYLYNDPNDPYHNPNMGLGQIQVLDQHLKQVDPGASFGLDFNNGGTLTLQLSNSPMWGPYAGQTLTGASALALWVNFSNFSIMNPFPAPGQISTSDPAVHEAVSAILMASVGDHYIAGDGRVNENFGLTSVHHIFHEEHNFQVQNFMDALHRNDLASGDPAHTQLHGFQVTVAPAVGDTAAAGVVVVGAGASAHYENAAGDYVTKDGTITWDLDKMFQSIKLIVEMEYQHAAVDQYARNVTPNIQEFVGYSPDKHPGVTLEYSQVAFRFGHSTLRETIDTIDPTHGLTGKIMGYALRDAFLNPGKYAEIGPAAILQGMSHQQMNSVDEFVTPALNQGLLGQPLDLAAINIARGRDIGMPTLNDFRGAIGLARYTSWNDFGNNMEHPSSLANFIAAYSFSGEADMATALAKAELIVGLAAGTIAESDPANTYGWTVAQAVAFLDNDGTIANPIAGSDGFNHIDTWLGGLAEVHQPGGLLGETFDLVFVSQIESLMDGDRFYYLYRLAGQQFAEEVGNGQLKDIVERNTGLQHLNGNIFGYADKYYDFSAKKEVTTDGTELQTTGNNHKYGDIYATTTNTDGSANFEGTFVSQGALSLHPTLGIYSNSGRTSALDGQVVTIAGQQYIRDTRMLDNGADTGANLLNGGTNLDGTPNSGADSNEVIVGTDRNDMIYAQGGDDTVYGEGGNDKIYGGYGIDRLYGGDGSDTIYGGDNPDLIDGGAGDDFLYGESSGTDINGNDQVIGGSGNDFISGGLGIDKLSGGTGDDHIVGDQDTDPFTHGSDGNDWVEGNSGGDILYGDNGDDLLVGGADQDQMFGGNGDDIIRPGDATGALTIGTDEVLGGDGVTDVGNTPGTRGFDLIDFSDNTVRPGGVNFDIGNQINPATAVNGIPIQVPSFQIEGVIGSAAGDTLIGNGDVEDPYESWVIGANGDDTLQGGLGNDIIIGGSIRLDALIGKYNSGYTHNNDNFGHTQAEQLEDARYQGASHRVLWSETIDSSGIIDSANAQFGLTGANAYQKHFTEMLRSDQFKDLVLGNSSSAGVADANGGTDTLILTGSRSDYTVEQVFHNSVVVGYRITDNVAGRDGSDIVLGITNFKFADMTLVGTNVLDLAPVISSNGGGATAALAINENTTAVTTVTATDANNVPGNPLNPQVLTYSITGGADQAKFAINAATGVLSFIAAPNFENPQDAGANNVYDVVVTVSDGILSDSQALAVTVSNVDEPSTGGLAITAATVAGNAVTITGTNTLSDPDMGPGVIPARWMNGATNLGAATAAPIVVNATAAVQTITLDASYAQPAPLPAVTAVAAETVVIGTTGNNGTNAAPISGGAGNDWMFGLNGNDVLSGGGGNDVINGGNGNDTLIGGVGNDTLDGGANTDVAAYSGNLSDFTFVATGSNTLTVRDWVGTGGTDSLTAIETLRVGATDFAVTVDGNGGNTFGNQNSNASQALFGLGGADTVRGGNADDILNGGAGNDIVNAGGGNDLIVQASTEGRDIIDGGAGTDTYTLMGDNTVETFRIYSATAWTALGAGHTLQNAASGIVITRNGTTNASVIAELRNVEEIKMLTSDAGQNGGALTNGNSYTGASGDTIQVIGNFAGTGLAYNTITVGGANSKVDITQLSSDHRVVLIGAGSSIIGAVRPQDVVNGVSGVASDAFQFQNGSSTTTQSQHLSDPMTGLELVNEATFQNQVVSLHELASVDDLGLVHGLGAHGFNLIHNSNDHWLLA